MQILASRNFDLAKEFILPNEFLCTNLASKIRKEKTEFFIISEQTSINSINDILGILLIDGSLIHCIPQNNLENLKCPEFEQVFKEFLTDKKIKCISGQAQANQFLVDLIKKINPQNPIIQSINYDLMILPEDPIPPQNSLSCDDYIKRCTQDDFDSLLDIQKKYLIKEVIPNGKQLNDLEVAISLRQILKNQLALALLADQEIVAKANSNAIGWNWVQIGGVFTHPLYRRNSYAWHLVYELSRKIRQTQRNVCLFVKEKNQPAIELYKHLGFKKVDKYQITYY
ncbi:MAG: GNAT family N-acetyltransferase [Treponema sp.]|nr:GNAT family N-acetyltransferase [Treponema sp.]